MKRNLSTLCLILALSGLGGLAADKSAVNPAGTWKITCTHTGKSQSYQPTLKLKLEADKLTGTITRERNRKVIEMALEDADLKDSAISFKVSIPPESGNGPKFVKTFHGKITGDIIRGTVDFPGQNAALDWEARRLRQ